MHTPHHMHTYHTGLHDDYIPPSSILAAATLQYSSQPLESYLPLQEADKASLVLWTGFQEWEREGESQFLVKSHQLRKDTCIYTIA